MPFDPQLGEWLKTVDYPLKPSILAAREFASQCGKWDASPTRATLLANKWLEDGDLKWMSDKVGTAAILPELEQMRQYMQDDRERYLAEIEAQADGLPAYILAFIGASQDRYPWTVELINCAMAISNVAYMRWKSVFKRVRPSVLAPGLLPPFGPPAHPAFPSGHATLGHLAALFLLEIKPLYQRYGIFTPTASGSSPTAQIGTFVPYVAGANPLAGTTPVESPLLWLADRVAKNRERLGVHYPSDSSAGRHLAAGMAKAMLHPSGDIQINCPSLNAVLRHAASEWAPFAP
ncbi:hypothetical protein QTH90_14065 [Variovorax sp. J2P1-59]|uniref:phosphatase PAP2 family protein n=1 Tax=Variovorax flavidus TaxID=3053501 RepID=UPI0025773756|nr:phosphatase PAP2 family protein [Variovorax sp. J2P1-59]MDM0075523.1 hypothetical protein [Variovorax sp. J2P1-59]